MDLSTRSESKSQVPAAGRSNLPFSARVYAGGGIPQLFRRVDEPTGVASEGWLYVPDDMLREIIGACEEPGRPGILRVESVTVEDGGSLQPLVIAGAVRGFVAAEPGSAGGEDAAKALEWFVHRELEGRARLLPAEAELAAALVTCDMSPERLMRWALNLLVEQVPSGLAAVYDQVEGLYRLRTAVGDIAKWDMLEGILPHSTVERWQEGISLGRHFLPAGFLPERPMFLDDAPDFLLVHHGPRSDGPRALLIMPIPGDITREAGDRVLAITRFVAALSENDLSISDDLACICSQFRSACDLGKSSQELLEKVHGVLARRLGLSRSVVLDDGAGGTVTTSHGDSPSSVRTETVSSISQAIRAGAGSGHFFVSDVSALGLLTEDEAKRYFLDNVRSEYCVRLGGPGRANLYVAFGHPEIGRRLKRFERLLDTTARFIDLYHRLEPKLTCSPEAAGRAAGSGAGTDQRWKTAGTMAEGHFHSVFDTLSWLLGKVEVSALTGGHASEMPAAPPVASITCDALTRVVNHLDHLRGLLRDMASPLEEPTPIERILANLPGVMQGRIHHLADLKNITLTLVVGPPLGRSFSFARGDVYDYLYPVVLAVMDEAEVSGEVHLRSATHRGADAVEISCPAALLGRTNFTDVIQKWSGEGGVAEGGGRVLFAMGRYVWVCDAKGRDPQRAWLVARQDLRIPSGRPTPARRDREGR